MNLVTSLQCLDVVGWVAGKAASLKKTEWWDAGVVICLGQGADKFAYGPPDATATHYLLLL